MLGMLVQCTKDSYAVLTVEALCVLSCFLVSPSASVVNQLLTVPKSIPSGTFSIKIQITCKITVFSVSIKIYGETVNRS